MQCDLLLIPYYILVLLFLCDKMSALDQFYRMHSVFVCPRRTVSEVGILSSSWHMLGLKPLELNDLKILNCLWKTQKLKSKIRINITHR